MLSMSLETQIVQLPESSLAERFEQTMQAQFTLMIPHRDLLSTLFGAALNPRSSVAVFGERTSDIRQHTHNIFVIVAQGAKNAPRASQLEDVATILYGLHMLLILFWLQDRSQEQNRTWEALNLARDLLALLRPLLGLPPVSLFLARVANVIGPMLGHEQQERL